MKITYVNVNEEGEDYDVHDTLEAALAIHAEFPNDTIEVRKSDEAVYEVVYHFDGLNGSGDRTAFRLDTADDGSETLHINMQNALIDLMLGYDQSEDPDSEELIPRCTTKQRAQIELFLWSLAQAHRDTPRGGAQEWEISLHRPFQDMDTAARILRANLGMDVDAYGRSRTRR